MDFAQPTVIAAMVFFASFLAIAGIALLMDVQGARKGWRSRVSGMSQDARRPDEKTGMGYLRDRVIGLLERLGQANQTQQKAKDISALRQALLTAGYRRASASAVFTGVKLLLAIVVPVIAFVLPIPALDDAVMTRQLMGYILLAGVGLYAPELWLRRKVTIRKKKILRGFPDALDLLVVCVEAGLGLDAAMGRAGVEISLAHPDLSDEFQMLGLELRAGLPRSQALTNLAKRCDLDEIKNLVAMLIQTDRFGTSIGQALRVHSDAMRTDRSLRAEEMAGKLPVKMLFPLMFFIFPSLFIVILGPAAIQGIRILLPTLGAQR